MSASLKIQKDLPNVDSYSAPVVEENLFVEEDENEVPSHSSVIQSGWGAAKKAVAKSTKTFATDFRFDEDVQLIKFISDEPMVFMQHWINRPGKKSFISIGEDDPLIAVGSKPDQKFVVCGHHSPSKLSTHPRYADDEIMNGGYSSNMNDYILDHPQIRLWTHGHTHHVFDYMIGSTRIVCNPRGYVGYEDRAEEFELITVEI